MKPTKKSQHGAFLVILLIIVAALIGFAALALDVGRLLILRAEMQNAVDAAALAAAKELDGKPGARARAVANARHALEHNNHFAKAKILLNEKTLPYVEGNDGSKESDTDAFTFFCVIGSDNNDIDTGEVDVNDFCGNGTTQYGADGTADGEKYVAPNELADEKSHYVRVRLQPNDQAPDNFRLNLIFLPVIEFFGGVTALREVSLGAVALAGRNWFACDYPPLAICNPFEPAPFGADQEVGGGMKVGQSVQLKQQGSNTWTPGNFGFLSLSGPGAGSVAEDLADETDLGCTPAVVTTKTGVNLSQTKSGLNTRFGIYSNNDDWFEDDYGSVTGGFKDSWVSYPPAPTVARYPPDPKSLPEDSRFGDGIWNCEEAWEDNHEGVSMHAEIQGKCIDKTDATTDWSRWQMYQWELNHEWGEFPPTPRARGSWNLIDTHNDSDKSIPERRVLHVAVLDCDAHGLSGGKTTATLFGNDGFAKMFLIQPATPGGSEPEDGSIYAEYMGWAKESDDFIHVEVKLFE